jgi:hypothetical protein
MEHECTMKTEIDIKFDKLQMNTKWVIGVCAGIVVALLIVVTTQGVVQAALRKQVTKINDNYAPIIIVQDIMENNAKTVKILLSLPEMTKDDPRYQELIQDKDKFQREALQRASTAKRGGGSSNGVMIE